MTNIRRKDPACGSMAEIFFCYPGFQAMLAHHLFHYWWVKDFGIFSFLRPYVKFLIRISAHITKIFTGIEIHPGAQIGSNFFIDHGTGVVIGETAIVGDNVTIYQGVTLGGVSTKREKRHPTLGNNIIIGAGAKVLGNITIGDCVQIGANSVVVKDIPAYSTVTGIPGRIVKMSGNIMQAIENLEHHKTQDYIGATIQLLNQRVDELEREVRKLSSGECKFTKQDIESILNAECGSESAISKNTC